MFWDCGFRVSKTVSWEYFETVGLYCFEISLGVFETVDLERFETVGYECL